jgi:predicted aspartyl protease
MSLARAFQVSLLCIFIDHIALGATQQSATASGTSQAATSTAPTATTGTAASTSLTQLLGEAKTAYRTGKLTEAADKYTKALAMDPKSGEAYAGLIRVYLKQEDVDKAHETAKQGVAVAPTASDLQTALGELYFREGKITDGEQQFVKVINSGAQDARAFLGLATVREALSMYKQEKHFIEIAYRLDPSDPDIQKAWMYTLKRPERIHYLETYLAGATSDTSVERGEMQKYLERLKVQQNNPRGTCQLVNSAQSTQAEMRVLKLQGSHIEGVQLLVEINGHKVWLLVDTGASGLMVKRSFAQKAGVTTGSAIPMLGIGDKGEVQATLGYADSIRVGGLEFKDCAVVESDSGIGKGGDGLIGPDVFSHYLVGLDFPGRKLKLDPLPPRPNQVETTATSLDTTGGNDPVGKGDGNGDKADSGPQDRYIAPSMKDYTAVFRFGHFLVIPTRVNDSPQKLFIIDSGSSTNAISARAAQEVTKIRKDEWMTVKGVSGQVANVYSADKAVLQFANFRQQNQDMTSWDFTGLSRDIGTEISGFVGYATLDQLELDIDYRDGLVNFVHTNGRW